MEESIGLAVGATAEVTPYLTAWDYLFTLIFILALIAVPFFLVKKYLLPRFKKKESYLNREDWRLIKEEIENGKQV